MWVVVLGSAIAGALAGTHATTTPVVDPLYAALLAGAVTAAGSVAARGTVLWLAAVVTAFSRGYVIFPALAGLVAAFASAAMRRPPRWLGAVAAALAVQVALRLPHTGFLGGSALVAGVAVAPCLVHGLTRMPRGARRAVGWAVPVVVFLGLLFSVPLAVEAVLARTDASTGTTATQEALRSVSDGNAAGGTAQLRNAESDFANVADRVGAWWTVGAKLVPIVSQQRRAALTGAQVARDVSATAGAEASKINFAQLHYQTGGIDLAEVEHLSGPLRQVDGQLTSGLRKLRRARSPWLVGPLERRVNLLTGKVSSAQNSASLADQAVADAPSLFGARGTRHYMLMLTDPAESRGLGGLVVSWGIITASQGHLTIGPIQDISKLNDLVNQRPGVKLTGPADFLARYGQFPAYYLQNVTYSPDLPTVASVVAQLWNHTGQPPLDGLLTVDPAAMASLLNFSGPVQVAGIGQMTASNAEEILERGQYAAYPSASLQTARRTALTDALKQALSNVAAGSLPGPRSLADTLAPEVHGGHLLFWSLHPTDDALLQRIGLAGQFPTASGGDLLGVVTNNAATNKADAYLERTVTDQVDYDPSTGRVSETVQVVLHNTAPSSGLSTEVIGSYGGSGLPPGGNRVWLTVYSPMQLKSATLSGGSPASVQTVPELGVETYSTFVNVLSGGSESLTFRFQGYVGRHGYGLHLYEQPSSLPTGMSVIVSEGGRGSQTWHPSGHSRDYRFF